MTLEGLEVLSLATTNSFPEGLPVRKLIVNVRDTGGTPVIPWGFGKWMGRRGKTLIKLLDTAKSADFFLGDNGNRTYILPHPSQMKLAQDNNIRDLPGSDPLPFTSESHRAGSFGFTLDGIISVENPAEDLKKILNNSVGTIQPHGTAEGALRFFRNQSRMQIKKHFFKKN